MDQILNELGGLVLGSVPTIVLFILLVAAYGLLVRRPLDRVLAERRARTSGAVEQARNAIAKAEAETAAYENKLRAAKAEIFQARDQKLKQWNAEREEALAQVRQHTQERCYFRCATSVSAAWPVQASPARVRIQAACH